MVATLDLQVNAPILPNEGLGGLKLRIPVTEIQDRLLAAFIASLPKNDWHALAGLFEARYRLGPVEIAIDVRNGKIFRLSAYEGYRGRLFGKISVGMKVSDAIALDPRLYYDEAEELLLVRGCVGVSLDVPEVDPDPAAVPAYPIVAISVYAEEVSLREEGLRGPGMR